MSRGYSGLAIRVFMSSFNYFLFAQFFQGNNKNIKVVFAGFLSMSIQDQSNHKNLVNELSERESVAASARLEKQLEEGNPQDTANKNFETRVPEQEEKTKKTSSKLLLRQKDRYENKGVEKGMFANFQESVDQLKVIYNDSSVLKKEQSTQSIKKRRPFKLNPIQNSSSTELITQSQLNKKSQVYQFAAQLPARNKMTPIRLKQIANFNQFAKQTVPVNKKLIGVLKRNRGGTKRFFPQLDFHFNQQLKYLMNSKRKPCHLTSNFHLGTSLDPVIETDKDYIGTLKSNFSGSQYSFIDVSGTENEILATITYTSQISCKSTPRELEVFILSPFYKYADLEGSDTAHLSMNLKDLYSIGLNKENKKILKLINKKPIYDESKDVWSLDFHGKALYSSVKNMILVDAQNQRKQAMLLAKSGEDVFNFDVMFPLSPRIALAIASSSFDFKWVSQ